MKKAAAFKQSDISRAIRGAQSAGMDVDQVKITDQGEINLYLKSSVKPAPSSNGDWDDVLE